MERFPNLEGIEGVFEDSSAAGGGGGRDGFWGSAAAGIAEWLIAFEDVEVGPVVGAGSSAVVLRGVYCDHAVAVKRLHPIVSRNRASDDAIQLFFKQEASLLAKLNHPNVVRFYGVSFQEPHLYIITEFCPSNLAAILKEARVTRTGAEGFVFEASRP